MISSTLPLSCRKPYLVKVEPETSEREDGVRNPHSVVPFSLVWFKQTKGLLIIHVRYVCLPASIKRWFKHLRLRVTCELVVDLEQILLAYRRRADASFPNEARAAGETAKRAGLRGMKKVKLKRYREGRDPSAIPTHCRKSSLSGQRYRTRRPPSQSSYQL